MIRTIVCPAALLCLATPASAIEGDKLFSESVLTFSRIGTAAGDGESANVSLAGGWDMGGLFFAGLEFDSSSVDGAGAADFRSFAIELDYPATLAVSLYLDAAYLELDGAERGFSEFGAVYSNGPWWAAAFAGQSDDGTILAEEYHGLSGGYAFGEGTGATLAWYAGGHDVEDLIALTLQHRTSRLDVTINALAFESRSAVLADVAYAVSGRVDMLGRFDLVDDANARITSAQLGVAYEVSGGLRAFGLVGRRMGDGDDGGSISIGLRYDTGHQTLRGQGTYDRLIDPILYDRAERFGF